MTVPSVHCEAKKVSYRQSKDGLVVSFVIHPQEMPDALAVAPLGQRYMLALAAIGDDEQPLPVEQSTPAERPAPPALSDRSARGKARYASVTERQQAVIRAARYPSDPRFREWVAERNAWPAPATKDEAIQYIRDLCFVRSRAEIETDDSAYGLFIRIETAYLQATGRMAEAR